MEKKPKAKKPLLPGALITPIRISKPPMPPGDASKILFPEALDDHSKDLANWRKEVGYVLATETLRKLQVLYKHLDIETSDHIAALRIASALAPGFGVQFKKGGSGKDVWNPILLAVLYHEVEKNRKVGESTANVCRRLSKRKWDGKRPMAGTLRNQYMAALKTPMVQKRLAWESDPAMKEMAANAWEEISQTLLREDSCTK